MAKSTVTYWNPLTSEGRAKWTSIEGLEGMAEELISCIDQITGGYTRLLASLLMPTRRCSAEKPFLPL